MILAQHKCLGINFAAMLKVQHSSQIFLKVNIFQYIYMCVCVCVCVCVYIYIYTYNMENLVSH